MIGLAAGCVANASMCIHLHVLSADRSNFSLPELMQDCCNWMLPPQRTFVLALILLLLPLLPAGFDLSQISPEFSNIGPLQQLVRDCGWGQQQAAPNSSSSSSLLWRRVPVVVKDVAGLVPGV